MVFIDKATEVTYLIDVAIPAPHNIRDKQAEKIRKYLPLAAEIKQIWKTKRVVIVPVIIGATGEIPKAIYEAFNHLNLQKRTYIQLQKVVILETCSIVRKVLNTE